MCLNQRFFLSVISLCSILLSPSEGHTLQFTGSNQSERESAILPKAKAILQGLPVSSAVSVVRMMIDLGCEDDVSIYFDKLGSIEQERLLKLLIQESGHFGSLATIDYVIDKIEESKQKTAVFDSCKTLANGKHFSLAIELARSRLEPDDLEVISVDIGTYAYIFGETEFAREVISDEYAWKALLNEELKPRRSRFIESKEFESSLGVDKLWSEILRTFRFNACATPASEQDLKILLNSEESTSLKLCSLFTWSASQAKARLYNEGRPYYEQFAVLLSSSDMKTQAQWNGERLFLAVKYQDEKFVRETLEECIEKGRFDIASACAGVIFGHCDSTVELATLAHPLKWDDAYYLSTAMRNSGLRCDPLMLSDSLQVQIVAALHLSPAQEQQLDKKQQRASMKVQKNSD